MKSKCFNIPFLILLNPKGWVKYFEIINRLCFRVTVLKKRFELFWFAVVFYIYCFKYLDKGLPWKVIYQSIIMIIINLINTTKKFIDNIITKSMYESKKLFFWKQNINFFLLPYEQVHRQKNVTTKNNNMSFDKTR